MKRKKNILFIIFFLSLVNICASQKAFNKIVHKYYRYFPYGLPFGDFVSNLMKDPTLTNKIVQKRTDSTLFFFKGDYTTHKPFSFEATRTEVRLAESEIQLTDSATKKDTLFIYQISGYSNTSENKGMTAQKEFIQFDRKYGRDFGESTVKNLWEKEQIVGTVRNYFLPSVGISPITVAWLNLTDHESVFSITLRLIKVENTVMMPTIYVPGKAGNAVSTDPDEN